MNSKLYFRRKLKSNLLRKAFMYSVEFSFIIQLILFYFLINEINYKFIFLFLSELLYVVFFYLMKINSSYYFNTKKLQIFFLKFLMPIYLISLTLFSRFIINEWLDLVLFVLIFLPRLLMLSTKVYLYKLEKLKLIAINEFFQIFVFIIFYIVFSSRFFLTISLSFLLKDTIYYLFYKNFFE